MQQALLSEFFPISWKNYLSVFVFCDFDLHFFDAIFIPKVYCSYEAIVLGASVSAESPDAGGDQQYSSDKVTTDNNASHDETNSQRKADNEETANNEKSEGKTKRENRVTSTSDNVSQAGSVDGQNLPDGWELRYDVINRSDIFSVL